MKVIKSVYPNAERLAEFDGISQLVANLRQKADFAKQVEEESAANGHFNVRALLWGEIARYHADATEQRLQFEAAKSLGALTVNPVLEIIPLRVEKPLNFIKRVLTS